MRVLLHFFCLLAYMFELGKSHFLAIFNPSKTHFSRTQEAIWAIFRNSGSNSIEPEIRKSSPLHETIILALENWSIAR